MALNSKDWQKLRLPILLLVVVLVLCGLFIHFAREFSKKQAQLLNAQESQLLIAKQKYLSSGSEKDEITRYLPHYQRLIQQGFIGEERRQMWIQSLQNIQKEYKLFPIEYKLNPLEVTQPSFVTTLGGFSMHQSTMQLDFDMLHEGDVLRLTESLAKKQFTNWLLRECTISKLYLAKDNGANLTANCVIDWFTLLEPVKS